MKCSFLIKSLVSCVALAALSAHAADRIHDGSQHELPTHKSWGQYHDTVDSFVDPDENNVCYVARQSDSHSMSMFCLPRHK